MKVTVHSVQSRDDDNEDPRTYFYKHVSEFVDALATVASRPSIVSDVSSYMRPSTEHPGKNTLVCMRVFACSMEECDKASIFVLLAKHSLTQIRLFSIDEAIELSRGE